MDELKWKTTLNDWLQGIILASAKMTGARQVKTIVRGMSMVFVDSLSSRIEEETNEKIMSPSANTIEAFEKYNQVEIKANLCKKNEVILQELDDEKVEITFHNCIYGDFCNKALSQLLSTGDFSEKTIPCLRLSNMGAAATYLAKVRSPYYLVQFAPGAVCKGIIKK